MNFLISFVLLVFSNQANAQDLSSGFKGIPFGDPSVLKLKPAGECSYRAEPLIEWTCLDTIAQIPVITKYIVEEDVYTSVNITLGSKSIQSDKDLLLSTLNNVWGVGVPCNQEGFCWKSTDNYATLKTDNFSNLIIIDIASQSALQEVEKRKKKQALRGILKDVTKKAADVYIDTAKALLDTQKEEKKQVIIINQ